MAMRTRDIINLREAARRCRGNADSSDGTRAEAFLRLAEEIDGLMLSLIAEEAGERSSRLPVAGIRPRGASVQAVSS
jgi:hypothetical protein